jgi:LysR family glycine cleavage system transcriptional activator
VDIDIRVRATSESKDLFGDDIDATIVYDRSVGAHLVSDRLMTEGMVPLCSPTLLSGDLPLNAPIDLLRHTLIHTETKIVTWPMWLASAGLDATAYSRGLRFNRADLALDAAKAGLGIALESRVLAATHIREGTLISPFPKIDSLDEGAYWFACRPNKLQLPKVENFREWIVSQSVASR